MDKNRFYRYPLQDNSMTLSLSTSVVLTQPKQNNGKNAFALRSDGPYHIFQRRFGVNITHRDTSKALETCLFPLHIACMSYFCGMQYQICNCPYQLFPTNQVVVEHFDEALFMKRKTVSVNELIDCYALTMQIEYSSTPALGLSLHFGHNKRDQIFMALNSLPSYYRSLASSLPSFPTLVNFTIPLRRCKYARASK